MISVLIALHLMIVIALVVLVLIQRSEGGGLGVGGGGNNFMSARGTANLLTRSTGVLAVAFFCTSIALTLVYKDSLSTTSTLDQLEMQNQGEALLNDLRALDKEQQENTGPVLPQSQ